MPNARAELERGSPTMISTSPIAAVVNTLYKVGHGEVKTRASVEQRRGSSLRPLLPLHVGCLAKKVYGSFSCRFPCLFSPSHLLSSPFLSCFLLGVTQIQSHMVGSTPRSPLRHVTCFCIARRIQQFLLSSTRVELSLLTF